MLARAGSGRLVHVRHAAVKKDAYLVELRDGRRTDDVERALGVLESKALPLLRELPSRWALQRPERQVVAEYLAMQMTRTPDALRRHGRLVDGPLEHAGYPKPAAGGWRHGRDGRRMHAMLFIGARMTTLVSAMQWTLVSFNAPVLSTSDHPVAVVPVNLSQTTPDLGVEVDNVGELWLAVTSRLAMVCCWRDLADTPRPRSGQRRIAEAINAAMHQHAEAGWYSHPAHPVPVRDDERIRICGELLFAGYGPGAIRRSSHRARALREIASHSGDLPGTTTVFHAGRVAG